MKILLCIAGFFTFMIFLGLYLDYLDESAHPSFQGWREIQDGFDYVYQPVFISGSGAGFVTVPQPKYKWVKNNSAPR